MCLRVRSSLSHDGIVPFKIQFKDVSLESEEGPGGSDQVTVDEYPAPPSRVKT